MRDVHVEIDGTLLVLSVPLAWMFAEGAALVLPWLARPVVALLSLSASAVALGLVVVHALAWAVASRASGLPITRVVVLPIGAVVDVEAEPPRPSAALGALGRASAVMGMFSLAGAVVAAVAASRAPVVTVLAAWTALSASVIALASALPAYPLAGGRALRAVAVAAGARIAPATRFAAKSGLVVGALGAIGGVLLSLSVGGGRTAAGVVVALLGASVVRAAVKAHGRASEELFAAQRRRFVRREVG